MKLILLYVCGFFDLELERQGPKTRCGTVSQHFLCPPTFACLFGSVVSCLWAPVSVPVMFCGSVSAVCTLGLRFRSYMPVCLPAR